jgi:hypothetical protein
VLQVAGGAWQEALSDAWRRTGTGRAEGNQNALKHGLYRKAAIEVRRQLRALIRQPQKLLQDIE